MTGRSVRWEGREERAQDAGASKLRQLQTMRRVPEPDIASEDFGVVSSDPYVRRLSEGHTSLD